MVQIMETVSNYNLLKLIYNNFFLSQMVRRLENEVTELRQNFDSRSEISNSTTSEGSTDSSSSIQRNLILKSSQGTIQTKSKYDSLLMKFSQKSKYSSKLEKQDLNTVIEMTAPSTNFRSSTTINDP